MYGWYAPDSRMRANVGIRRRLAPLLDNSRKEIELANALLLSMPGTPCLYYGDEIGMGDNIWLPDRDAVRTPMQWTPDRNAGFSTADPGKLYLPLVQSLVHHYSTPTSRRSWRSRRRCCTGCAACSPSVGSTPRWAPASSRCCRCDNESVLAFCRHSADETILVVANMASTARAATMSCRTVRAGRCTTCSAAPRSLPSAPTGPRPSPSARATSTGWS